jgi:hypothetical protein
MVKRVQRVMLVSSWLAFAVVASGQQTQQTQQRQQTPAPAPPAAPKPPQGPTSSAIVRTYSAAVMSPTRQTETRTQSAGREVSTQKIEVQGPDGKFKTFRDATTETVGIGTKSVQSTQTVYGNDADGRRVLVQQTQADQQVLTDGTTQTVENIFDADLNGRLGLSQRSVTEEKSIGRGVKQTDKSIFQPSLNEPLRETERVHEIERQISPNVVQSESTRSVRTADGQFQTVETRNHELRKTGTTGSTEEETINRTDANGALTPFARNVTQRSSSNGRDEVVTESYTQSPSQGAGRLELKERSRTTTTTTVDGSHQTTQELERANPVPNGPLRVVERTVETLRRVGPDRWETERQVFSLDANGRLVPTVADRGQSVGK